MCFDDVVGSPNFIAAISYSCSDTRHKKVK